MFVVYTRERNTFFVRREDDVLHIMSDIWHCPESSVASQALSKMRIGDKINIGPLSVFCMRDSEARKLADFFGIAEEFRKEYGVLPI